MARKIPKDVTDSIARTIQDVIVDEMAKSVVVKHDWKIKAYKVGAYFRVDIFPPAALLGGVK